MSTKMSGLLTFFNSLEITRISLNELAHFITMVIYRTPLFQRSAAIYSTIFRGEATLPGFHAGPLS